MTTRFLPTGLHVLERGWLSSNNIVFSDGAQTVMVDSGYCTHAAQTLALVEDILGERPLDLLVNTHLHSDHCGGNAALQNRYPALETRIPPGESAHIAQWNLAELSYEKTGQLCPRFSFSGLLKPGSTLRFGLNEWEVHAAAGHDPHSVIFFEPAERILVSADALWENGFGVVFPELDGLAAFDEVSATLDLIEKLKPKIVIPGHGPVFHYREEVLIRSRKRLEGFLKDPVRHARHAAKVMLKFKLLEVQKQAASDFYRWACETPYLMDIRARFFSDLALGLWIAQLCDELVAAGAAQRNGVDLLNG